MRVRKVIAELSCQHCGVHFFGEYFSDETTIICGGYCKMETKIIVERNQYEDMCEWCPEVDGYCAYIIMCKNGKTYKGYTGDFKKRMTDHFNLQGCETTIRMKPEYILHYEVLDSRIDALRREKYFKTISGLDNIKSRIGKLNTIYPSQYNK